ncbi:uncharacterized protein L969DRAFT_82929 [Mixia osmundae IAM 14324]|uniref:uncharacterized protein n=1 Tax=Mixia osmundae (strain CBS 9802 / IAM 14324 / JCM 22182 / KY 12970) TaxID=764103 RepID=UPI0004A54BF8|nr:uncharacterized protein L969DRAFT_83595 [Mixia osmundae IAM 14324]XP_014566730.1 uncharacterized protein L969DRAFT_82929 [Mixia osmundae IAM 14324]KEI36202.1 hypothetical protein L969DRAFT_83595 [Mixia osmundae IAM 14324]KEI38170.1 hypothetical protein L969DRAFT_82929 [Mixia osmundae IAM 14324]
MRVRSAALALGAWLAWSGTPVRAEEETLQFQSDVARLMRVVVSHLYHHRDVFLRELVSNAGDALEKLRFQALTDSTILTDSDAPYLNISIKTDANTKTLTITDYGIGMSKEDLTKNLGTIARSGTSEFLSKLESGEGKTGAGANLIGQFGLGFYSSFLVADRVQVASKANNDPVQWVFESEADAAEFKIREDPRGITLGRGTEITLFLKDDAQEYLGTDKIKELVAKHSEFATSAPIYLWTSTTGTIPRDDEDTRQSAIDDAAEPEFDEDGNIIEKPKKKAADTRVTVQKWSRINDRPPIWMRDPKNVTSEEYISFYKNVLNKDSNPIPEEGPEPAMWTHFSGDAGRTSFKALIYAPKTIVGDFYTKSYQSQNSARLYVKRVFITSDLGDEFLPKWLNWVKVVIDADDLPLNVGRDTLQHNRSLKQIQSAILRKAIEMFTNAAKNDPATYKEFHTYAATPFKLAHAEDKKLAPRLLKLIRFRTSVDDFTSLDDYVSRRKQGQTQMYYMAGAGQSKEILEKSPFVETALARGYEVLYLTEPMDEIIASSVPEYEGMKFQDVAKKGLIFGDEDDDDSKAAEAELKEEYEPLVAYLKKELDASVSEVVLSTRLTTSPCAVTADSYAWTANMERLMAAQSGKTGEDFMTKFIRESKRILEINPHHPLIRGLLEKVADIEDNATAAADLSELTNILWDTSLVKSGYNVKDANLYFSRIEALLRRSLGVSETAQPKVDVKPAPPVDPSPITQAAEAVSDAADSVKANIEEQAKNWPDWKDLKDKITPDALKEAPAEEPVSEHDEL